MALKEERYIFNDLVLRSLSVSQGGMDLSHPFHEELQMGPKTPMTQWAFLCSKIWIWRRVKREKAKIIAGVIGNVLNSPESSKGKPKDDHVPDSWYWRVDCPCPQKEVRLAKKLFTVLKRPKRT